MRALHNEKFQTLDISLHQRNEVVEQLVMQLSELGTEFICKDFMNGLAAVEQAEFVYSHEYRTINNHQQIVVAQEPIIVDFVAPNFPKYVQQRCKHNLLRSLKLRLIRGGASSNQDDQSVTVLSPSEGNLELTVKTPSDEGSSKLSCSCG